MRGTRYGVFGYARLWGEKAAYEIAVLAPRGNDESAGVQGCDLTQVGFGMKDLGAGAIHQQIIRFALVGLQRNGIGAGAQVVRQGHLLVLVGGKVQGQQLALLPHLQAAAAGRVKYLQRSS